ncbi:hypothetical protein LOK49_LG11G01872 [Camellia lanceoleosa]|uniref:Uncharacterized protein n=1 Tax=Camellia lanceoleosa TaxID=1840588 RepID=A0ACC0G458_9ERIC|nr:hypothetical protein LOK49_LG11G01872 [Camellia lanceoleosa]
MEIKDVSILFAQENIVRTTTAITSSGSQMMTGTMTLPHQSVPMQEQKKIMIYGQGLVSMIEGLKGLRRS